MTFEEFVERKDAARAERDRGRVTWRRVAFDPEHPDRREWSGLGSNGRLVYVRVDGDVCHYGRRLGVDLDEVGTAPTTASAKWLAALLLREES